METMMKPTGYVYNGSCAYSGPRLRMFCYWSTKPAARHAEGGAYIMHI